MPQLSTNTERNFFKIFLQGFNTLIGQAEENGLQYYREQIALGRNPQEVLNEFKSGDAAVIRQMRGGIETRIDLGLNTVYQVSSNEPLEGVATKFKWTLDPSAEHCDSCIAQAAKEAGDFRSFPMPGTQPTIGETNCARYCKCTLEAVE